MPLNARMIHVHIKQLCPVHSKEGANTEIVICHVIYNVVSDDITWNKIKASCIHLVHTPSTLVKAHRITKASLLFYKYSLLKCMCTVSPEPSLFADRKYGSS